jgi:tartrate dehydratase beta subunit/fumarate hydratase class I family protein
VLKTHRGVRTESDRIMNGDLCADMDAAWRIELENFPTFIVMDDKGNDFYEGLEWLPAESYHALLTGTV